MHWHVPSSFEALYQEAGRAARDGKPATAIIYHSDEDAELVRFILRKSSETQTNRAPTSKLGQAAQRHTSPPAGTGAPGGAHAVGRGQNMCTGAPCDGHVREERSAGASAPDDRGCPSLSRRLVALDSVIRYCTLRHGCRRAALLAHFGEVPVRSGVSHGRAQPHATPFAASTAAVSSSVASAAAHSQAEADRCCDLCRDPAAVAGAIPNRRKPQGEWRTPAWRRLSPSPLRTERSPSPPPLPPLQLKPSALPQATHPPLPPPAAATHLPPPPHAAATHSLPSLPAAGLSRLEAISTSRGLAGLCSTRRPHDERADSATRAGHGFNSNDPHDTGLVGSDEDDGDTAGGDRAGGPAGGGFRAVIPRLRPSGGAAGRGAPSVGRPSGRAAVKRALPGGAAGATMRPGSMQGRLERLAALEEEEEAAGRGGGLRARLG